MIRRNSHRVHGGWLVAVTRRGYFGSMTRRGFASFLVALPLLGLTACKEPPPAQMAGTWESTYDEKTKAKLTITQAGNKVSGSYAGDSNSGTFEGTVSGTIITGTWKEGDTASARGSFRWSLDADGNRFTGRYDSEDKKHGGSWNGVKL